MKNSIKKPTLYKAANVTFDSQTVEAHSYAWWKFVKVIQGLVVFNEYRYSNTTSKHQYKVRALMRQLGIEVDLYVQTKESLDKQTVKQLIKKTKQVETETIERLKAQQRAAYERRKAKMKSVVEKVVESAYAQ